MVLAVSLGISEEKKVDETETGEQEEIVETAYGSGTVEIEDSIKGILEKLSGIVSFFLRQKVRNLKIHMKIWWSAIHTAHPGKGS